MAAVPPTAWILLACFALATLSLLGPSRATYDPTAWLIWGRGIVDWDFHTTFGPSWKPLPVIFTTPFALFGDDAAPLLWLVVARAGGLFAIALGFRLAARLGGVLAGVVAVVAMVLAEQFVYNFWRGNSEGLLVALSLWAIERHLDGRRWQAFGIAVAAGLLRPEVWPFLAVYGLWLIWKDWRGAPPWRTIAIVAGSGIAVIALWLVPEYIGSGDFLRAASRAREPVANSPAQADRPFLAVFENSHSALSIPVYAGAILAIAFAGVAWRRRRQDGPVLAIALIAAALMVIVAVFAEIGFTGNLRYVTLPAALVCVLAGVGWSRLLGALRGRFGLAVAIGAGVVALAASAAFVVRDARRFGDEMDQMRSAAKLSEALPAAIDRAGGEAAIKRCGPVSTTALQTQIVAYLLHLQEAHVGAPPRPTGTRFHPRGEGWEVKQTCG
ncbi:hypothetical protein DSM104329_05209 [Capillimicrobium parvum]|uniref:Uncharacterized protein n=1 Tax=Capillimicrobium parvum TaxID=2884022 RepID=A0A9E6Y2E8_9ACTN|nr:hypothetical protein DSM104329_05209 [Capillimicrobium parvum]